MDRNRIPLDRVAEGKRVRVERLETEGAMRRRLLDLGLVEGTWVECVLRAAAGGPAAYLIRGAVVALRREDAAGILVSA